MKFSAAKHKFDDTGAPHNFGKNHPALSEEERLNHIATAAYYKAEARGFEQGQALDDWLKAEAEIDATN